MVPSTRPSTRIANRFSNLDPDSSSSSDEPFEPTFAKPRLSLSKATERKIRAKRAASDDEDYVDGGEEKEKGMTKMPRLNPRTPTAPPSPQAGPSASVSTSKPAVEPPRLGFAPPPPAPIRRPPAFVPRPTALEAEVSSEEEDLDDDDDDEYKEEPDVKVSTAKTVERKRKQPSDLDRPHVCQTEGCDKAFARKSDLVRHERIHNQDRPWKCDWKDCDKAFIQRSALSVHKRTHTGERPHECTFPECDKKFADSSSLARHRRIHTGARPYVCPAPDCARTYCRKITLVKHINRLHPENGQPLPLINRQTAKSKTEEAASTQPQSKPTSSREILNSDEDSSLSKPSRYPARTHGRATVYHPSPPQVSNDSRIKHQNSECNAQVDQYAYTDSKPYVAYSLNGHDHLPLQATPFSQSRATTSFPHTPFAASQPPNDYRRVVIGENGQAYGMLEQAEPSSALSNGSEHLIASTVASQQYDDHSNQVYSQEGGEDYAGGEGLYSTHYSGFSDRYERRSESPPNSAMFREHRARQAYGLPTPQTVHLSQFSHPQHLRQPPETPQHFDTHSSSANPTPFVAHYRAAYGLDQPQASPVDEEYRAHYNAYYGQDPPPHDGENPFVPPTPIADEPHSATSGTFYDHAQVSSMHTTLTISHVETSPIVQPHRVDDPATSPLRSARRVTRSPEATNHVSMHQFDSQDAKYFNSISSPVRIPTPAIRGSSLAHFSISDRFQSSPRQSSLRATEGYEPYEEDRKRNADDGQSKALVGLGIEGVGSMEGSLP